MTDTKTTIHRVDPGEYRDTPLGAIGSGEGFADPSDDPTYWGTPAKGRLPEPEPGSLEESILKLRRGFADQDLFHMERAKPR